MNMIKSTLENLSSLAEPIIMVAWEWNIDEIMEKWQGHF